jgi:hypothetical protein
LLLRYTVIMVKITVSSRGGIHPGRRADPVHGDQPAKITVSG